MTTFLMLEAPPLCVIVAFCELDVFIERLDLSAAPDAFFYKVKDESSIREDGDGDGLCFHLLCCLPLR